MDLTKRKVLLGLSGGVDSAAAAALLLEQGCDVTALTLWTWPDSAWNDPRLKRAAHSAKILGLKHIVLDVRREFHDNVIDPFIRDWKVGQTSNPCVTCNATLKFQKLRAIADELGCDYFATGHYARLTGSESGRFLMRARYRDQDQSYFLYRLTQSLLDRLIFPLGEKNKQDARAIASMSQDPVAGVKDSQDICFLESGNLKDFLKKRGLSEKTGSFLNRSGQVIGEHKGSWLFTVGQRRRLGQSFGKRMTVLSINHTRNAVVLGDEEDALMYEMALHDVVYLTSLSQMFGAEVQLRSQGTTYSASVTMASDKQQAVVRFEKPVRLSSPGQSAVFYDGDRVIGGGIVGEMT
ncbi:MAG: tRNA 2-thiouridine(34) synthase MnmA [Clostridiaceae bacterium]|nr:tRNA 2-thiouridine(34) synthase MnmA [Clostridiaceae bacterium]